MDHKADQDGAKHSAPSANRCTIRGTGEKIAPEDAMTEKDDLPTPPPSSDEPEKRAESLPPLPEGMKTAREELLSDLLNPRARAARAARQADAARRTAQVPSGLTPFDLITDQIPAVQQLLINWVRRRKQARFEEISAFVAQHNIHADQVQPMLDAMLEKGQLHQAILDGEVCYRVVFRGSVRRTGIGLPDELWQSINQDRLSFLRGVALFNGLSDDQLAALAAQMDEVRYQRGDVLLWQGKSSDRVFFIKSGIVGITHYSAQTKEQKILNYIRQGDVIGEYSAISGASGVASATASALSTVQALTLKRADFLAMLNQHASVAIELARILAVRLVNSGVRAGAKNARVVLVIGAQTGVGASSIGMAVALTLAAKSGQSVAYTEMPDARQLSERFHLSAERDTYTHGGGYDVIAQLGSSILPQPVRATLLLDQLFARYANLVINVPGYAEETIGYLAGYADQVVLVSTPVPESLVQLAALNSAVRRQVNVEKVGIFSVLNHTAPEQAAQSETLRADFNLPFHADAAPQDATTPDGLPEAIRHFASTLIDRLGRTNAVSLYIPTTIDVNTAVDTTLYVNRTLAFLGQLFGGATTTTMQARGVWNSAEAGLVGEDIHIVRSYATQADLDAHLQKILDYVEGLKQELRQEAMAVEINQKLMLI
ncbi:cyclic nucleotide-binding domain-containing protein [Chloroflexi bacterium CFX3]|nr:cyclic nucleotide-binding domain-containing protein [Chloroflexi bacterium CFX3]